MLNNGSALSSPYRFYMQTQRAWMLFVDAVGVSACSHDRNSMSSYFMPHAKAHKSIVLDTDERCYAQIKHQVSRILLQ